MKTIANLLISTQTVFSFLVMAVFAHAWLANDPIPFGGSNVLLTAMAVGFSVLYAFFNKKAVFPLPKDFSRVFFTFGVFLLWAIIIFFSTETAFFQRLAQTILGLGLLFAVHIGMANPRRAEILMNGLCLAVCLSILFGIGLFYVGEPFFSIWIKVAQPEHHLIRAIAEGSKDRLLGIEPTVIGLGYKLAIAIPWVLAMLLYNPLREKKSRICRDTGLCFFLVILATGTMANNTRSTILGIGCVIIIMVLFCLIKREAWKRCLFLVFLMITGSIVSLKMLDIFREKYSSQKITTPLSQLDYTPRHRTSMMERPIDHLTHLKAPRKIQYNRMAGNPQGAIRLRMAMFHTAFAYTLEHPWGTGLYSPHPRHIKTENLNDEEIRRILFHQPHSQFFGTLVYYGFIGILLLCLFYFFIFHSLVWSTRRAFLSENRRHFFLSMGLGGGLVSYIITSLFHNAGPFTGDWHHFFLIGLVLNLPLMIRSSHHENA